MITDKDITKLKTIFSTKEDLKNSVQEMMDYTNTVNEASKNELHEELVSFKDEILHEIINLRDDIAIVLGFRDRTGHLEHRVARLESSN